MGTRVELHAVLTSLLGTENVYFQPPPSYLMTYPCIIYSRSKIITRFAGDAPYSHTKQYTLTVIDKDPDSSIPDLVAKLPRAIFDRHYTADGLNHDVFTLYY